MRRQSWHLILVPCAMLAYVLVAYGRYLTWRPEIFPISAWSMFATQKRYVTDFGVQPLPAGRCAEHATAAAAPAGLGVPAEAPLRLDTRQRQLAAAAYRLAKRREPDAEHFRALLEAGLLPAGACYEILSLRLDSWSEPPGAPTLRGRAGPYESQLAELNPDYQSKGKGTLAARKETRIEKKRRQP